MESPQQKKAGATGKTGGAVSRREGKTIKRCSYCGAKNKASFEYCIRCSEPLDESAPEGAIAQDRAALSRLFLMGVAAVVALAAVALVVRGLGREAAAPPPDATPATAGNLTPREAPVLPQIEAKEVLASFNAGLAAFNAKDYRAAAGHFSDALRSIPDNPTAHHYLGLCYFHLEEYPGALSSLAKARELRPESFELLDHYVTIAKKAGDLEAAAAALREFIAANPDMASPRLELSRIARTLGDSEESLQQAEVLARAQEASPEFQYELGVSLKEAGKLEEAKAALRSAIELNPDAAVAHHALGVTELQSGKPGQALAPLQAAVARAPENGDFRFSLAQAYEKLERIPESLAAYEEYLKHASASDPRAKVVRERLEIAKKALAERQRSSGPGKNPT